MFNQVAKPYLLPLLVLLLSAPLRAEPQTELKGLAVYTETARDIYVAGLYLDPDTGFENMLLSPGPKTMEYRIATRRISSRGFFGTLLLQAELGSGERVPEAVIQAVGQLKGKIKGALIQGDQFQIQLKETDRTAFTLNGELLTEDFNGEVFDYFFAGWAGETASRLIYDNLVAEALDEATSARYEELSPSSARMDTIADWVRPPKPEEPIVEIVATQEPDPEAAVEQPESIVAAETAEAAELAEEVTVAVLATESGPESTTTPETSALEIDEPEIDDLEYQRQLSDYLTHVMTPVFGEVQYPRRAISRGRQGKVELLAKLDSAGKLIDLTLDNSSGSRILDRAAVAAVQSAAPFPELTPVAQEEFLAEDGESYVVMIPVTFRLD